MDLDHQLSDLLNSAVDTLEPRTELLVARATVRGRTLRRRRRFAHAASGVALAAMITGIGVAVWPSSAPTGPAAGRSGAAEATATTKTATSASSAARTSAPAAGALVMSPQLALKTVLDLLPGDGTTAHYTGRSSSGWAGAEFVYDDGHGRAEVAVSFTFPRGSTAGGEAPCTPAGDSSCTILSDGSHLAAATGLEYPYQHVPNATEWSVNLVRPDGAEIGLMEWNAPQEKDAATSRPQPPFTIAELGTIVRSPRWAAPVSQTDVDSAAGLFTPDRLGQTSSTFVVPASCVALADRGQSAEAQACTQQAKSAYTRKMAGPLPGSSSGR